MLGFGLLVLWATTACSALRMNAATTYAASNCSGAPQATMPTTLPGACVAIGSTSSRSASCDQQTFWDSPNCQGSSSTFAIPPCANTESGSVAYSCVEFERVVKVQIRYGACSDRTTSEVYLQLDRCTPVSGPPPSAGNVTNQYSYKATQTEQGYGFGYYYKSDCSNAGLSFPPARQGECVTAGTGGSRQSITVTATSSATALGATGAVVIAVLALFS